MKVFRPARLQHAGDVLPLHDEGARLDKVDNSEDEEEDAVEEDHPVDAPLAAFVVVFEDGAEGGGEEEADHLSIDTYVTSWKYGFKVFYYSEHTWVMKSKANWMNIGFPRIFSVRPMTPFILKPASRRSSVSPFHGSKNNHRLCCQNHLQNYRQKSHYY